MSAAQLEKRAGMACEVRVSEDGKRLVGYAAKFDSPSEPIGGHFREIIRKGAFADSLKAGADVRLLVNHDPGKLLARTKSGTLTLTEDDVGLRFDAVLPATTLAKDVVEQVGRGDLSGMSFGFNKLRDNWGEDAQGFTLRELLAVSIFDVSLATYPAYDDTEVSLREYDAWKAKRPTPRRAAADRRMRMLSATLRG